MDDNLCVVAIDDDPIILNSIVSTLKDKYKVRPFTLAETALKFIESNSVGVILLDCNMPPGIDGYKVLKILKNKEKLRKIPVIFLTGETDDLAEVKALEMGAVDYLKKPFSPISLKTRVKLQADLYAYRSNLEESVLQKTEELRKVVEMLKNRDKITLNLLAELSDLRDHDTGAHILRTTLYCEVLVKYIIANPIDGYKLTHQEGEDIVEAVKLHDLGKISVPDVVLLKPGRLTEEEFEIIKTHTTEGAKMLEKSLIGFDSQEEDNLLLTAYYITYEHHEKWNGTGYPRGISGDEIKLSARIAAVADVFDALTSARPYKRPFTSQEAFEILYRDSGTHFDPYLIEIVKKCENDFVSIIEKSY
ncbi:MAG: response regulator [Chitinispirillales bacterium]|nr:response regulator [Chitinispirillales bacterium]